MPLWIGIVGVAVLLVGAVALQKQSQKIAGILAVLAILGAAGLLSTRFRDPAKARIAAVQDTEEMAGAEMARRIAADFPSGGSLLVLRRPMIPDAPYERSAARFRTFEAALKDRGFELEVLGVDPGNFKFGPSSFDIVPEASAAREVKKRCAKSPPPAAVVSLLPWLPPAPESKEGMPAWYVFDGGPFQKYRAYMDRDLIKLAFIMKESGATEGAATAFEAAFQVVTPKAAR